MILQNFPLQCEKEGSILIPKELEEYLILEEGVVGKMMARIVVINERMENIEREKTLPHLSSNYYATSSFFLYFVWGALMEGD